MYIAVDFDGTLATDETGDPIPAMVERIKRWREKGIPVRILTARVASKMPEEERLGNKTFIENWCQAVFGEVFPVTAEKDYQMYQLWDDRAVQVVKDTGARVGQINRPIHRNFDNYGAMLDEESGYRERLA
jgi:hydroxymethylpyrimidine pyrophosphatase-like HAD family hydrolase